MASYCKIITWKNNKNVNYQSLTFNKKKQAQHVHFNVSTSAYEMKAFVKGEAAEVDCGVYSFL